MHKSLDTYRSEFPALREKIQMNHAGVSPTSLRVARAIDAWTSDLVQHGLANERAWEARAEETRVLAARLIGAKPTEIAFVRNTSHGLGLVAEGLHYAPGDEIAVAASLEYPSNVYPWQHLRDRGVVVRELPVTFGGITPEAVACTITPRTRVVALSSVQYATGYRADLDAIGEVCAKAGVLFCVDGIQSVGCTPVDVKRSRIHFLSADSHKWMLGINGIGFLYVDENVTAQVRPVLVGWKSTVNAWDFNAAHFELRSDASKLEEGSPSYTGIYALAAALELLHEVGVETIEARIGELLTDLDTGLRALGCETGPTPEHRAGILAFTPPHGHASDLAAHLAERRFALSLRRERIRVSPHFYNRSEEISELIETVRTFLDKR
jgi:cysteine desulfurase / selenocysteine lyase